MTGLYDFVAGLAQAGWLPSIYEHTFMARGLIAALLIGPVLGAIGTLVVAKRLVFFVQTTGHAALAGVAIGLLIGEPIDATLAGLFGTCLIVALAITYLRNRIGGASDTVVGLVLAQVLGIGVVLMVLVTQRYSIHQIEGVLFGSLITLTDLDLLVLAAIGMGGFIAVLVLYNPIMLATLKPSLARVRGHSPTVLDYAFVVVATLVVTASLKLVGALLVLVLVVIPAAGARQLATGLTLFFWASVAIGMVSTTGGLLLSGVWSVPTGAAIVLVASGVFYAILFVQALRPKRPVAGHDNG